MQKSTKKQKRIGFILIAVLLLVIVIGVLAGNREQSSEKYETPEDLTGKRITVQTGTIFDGVAEEYIEDVEIVYGQTDPDCAIILDSGKADGFITDEPLGRCINNTYQNFRVLCRLGDDDYAFIFKKDSAEATALCAQLNEFLAQIKADGTLAEIDSIWFGSDESKMVVDVPTSGENGTLSFGTTATSAPFAYVKDGQFVGYEVDIAARFCRAYGYGLEIVSYDFAGLLAAVQTGKGLDFGAACITVTEERAEKILFSDPDYAGGVVLIVADNVADDGKTFADFWQEQVDNFKSTFIKENRWKLFAQGIGRTALITLLTIICGTLLGFLLFWGTYELGRGFNAFVTVYSRLVDGMPMVVLLMILYYIIFGSSDFPATGVAVIGFSLVFGSAVCASLRASAATVSGAQVEAALALGFTPTRTLFKVILPQALRQFLPKFQSEIVSLIKSTAVVGYIAVQDLTKMGDIVRARTYEAFFPLIVVAIIYFLLEFLLIAAVKAVRIGTDPKRRPVDKILKGVTRNDH